MLAAFEIIQTVFSNKGLHEKYVSCIEWCPRTTDFPSNSIESITQLENLFFFLYSRLKSHKDRFMKVGYNWNGSLGLEVIKVIDEWLSWHTIHFSFWHGVSILFALAQIMVIIKDSNFILDFWTFSTVCDFNKCMKPLCVMVIIPVDAQTNYCLTSVFVA